MIPICTLVAASAVAPQFQDAPRLERVHETLPFDAGDSRAMILEDFDGDGSLDLFVLHVQGFEAGDGLFLGDGHGRFEPAPTGSLPRNSGAQRGIVAADLDGDGDSDLLLGDALFLNDGHARFTDVTSSHLPATWIDGRIGVADVDGDGHLDAVLAARGRRTELFLGDGSGALVPTAGPRFPNDFDDSIAIDIGDVDGDGKLDVVVGTEEVGRDHLYLGDGLGFFHAAPSGSLPATSYSLRSLALGDVDGDGDLDLALGHRLVGPVARRHGLYLNDGGGRFTDMSASAMPILAVAQDAPTLELVDANGDGHLDYWAPSTLLIGDGTGAFSDVTLPNRVPLRMDAMAIGDIDEDGDPDLIAGPTDGCFIGTDCYWPDRILLNRGDGRLTDVTAGDVPLESSFSADDFPNYAAADVDGDGDVDLVGGSGNRGVLLENDGTGRFSKRPHSFGGATVQNVRDLALGDVDGDGDMDILFAGSFGGSELFLNDGAAGFTPSAGVPFGQHQFGCAMADIDQDGDLDLALARDDEVVLLLGDGSGAFVEAPLDHLPAPSGQAQRVAFVDADSDGDPDLVVSRSTTALELYINGGDGRFRDGSALVAATVVGAQSIATGDLDGDSAMDLAIANDAGRFFLLDGDGTGRLVDATQRITGSLPLEARGVELADLDEDGDLDLIALGLDATQVFVNDGLGSFSPAPPTADIRPVARGDVAVARDFDGDGDVDVFIARHRTQSTLHRNTGRQIVARGRSRSGHLLEIDVLGPPGASFTLSARGFAPGGAVWPTQPIFVGTLDQAGQASYVRQIPADPALAGLVLEVEGVIGGRPANVERVVLLDV